MAIADALRLLESASGRRVVSTMDEGVCAGLDALGSIAAAQVHAQLEIAAQLKRIADAIEEHTA